VATLYKTDGGRQSSGFFAEKKDCTVRSFACAADIPYSEAHAIMKRSGRRDGRGWWSERGLAVAKADGLLDFAKVPCAIPARNYLVTWPTVAQVIARYKTGRYIICTRRHAMALIDGTIHDTGLVGLRSRITSIFEVKPTRAAPAITQSQVNELWERLNRLEAR
jgi:hypothetical protein